MSYPKTFVSRDDHHAVVVVMNEDQEAQLPDHFRPTQSTTLAGAGGQAGAGSAVGDTDSKAAKADDSDREALLAERAAFEKDRTEFTEDMAKQLEALAHDRADLEAERKALTAGYKADKALLDADRKQLDADRADFDATSAAAKQEPAADADPVVEETAAPVKRTRVAKDA